MPEPPYRIVLVDDHQILLDSLRGLLDTYPQFEVVGTACSAVEGLRMVLDLEPDVAVLDVEMPGRGSFDIAQEISSRQKNSKVIFLSGFQSDVFVEQALRVNANGYLLKGEPSEFLVASIEAVAKGESRFSESILERLQYDPLHKRYHIDSQHQLISLTTRQLAILRHLAKGQSVKEVARHLHVSEKSVDSHKYRIMHTLGIHDRVELARYAIREGLSMP